MNRPVIVWEGKAHEFKGICLGFCSDYEELPNGIGQAPCAIVEKEDGSIEIPYIRDIRFINKPVIQEKNLVKSL